MPDAKPIFGGLLGGRKPSPDAAAETPVVYSFDPTTRTGVIVGAYYVAGVRVAPDEYRRLTGGVADRPPKPP
jgi:hypothetical protein